MACDLAKANTKADIAGSIATEITKQFDSEVSGNSAIDENNPQVRKVKEFASSFLSARIQRSVYGGMIKKTYWEKRQYEVERGAAKNFRGFTCAILVEIAKKSLDKSIALAEKELEKVIEKEAPQQLSKEQVQEIIKKTKENLNK